MDAADPADRQGDRVDGHRAQSPPDGVPEVKARIVEPPSHRERQGDVTPGVLHERGDQAEGQTDVRLGLVMAPRRDQLETAETDVRVRGQRVAVDGTAKLRRQRDIAARTPTS